MDLTKKNSINERTTEIDAKIYVKVSAEPFDLLREQHRLKIVGLTGAVVSFTGIVRDFNSCSNGSIKGKGIDDKGLKGRGMSERVEALFLEYYPGMTEQALENIAARAAKRWPLQGVSICHRVGPLSVADDIVLVSVASSHRSDSFSAAMYIMDYLKTEAPFWKKTRTSEGENWVKAQDSDVEAQKRWL